MLKSWLCTLYKDQARHIATSCSISPDSWTETLDCLCDNAVFLAAPSGTSFQLGSRLLSIRCQDVRTKVKVAKVQLTGKQVWLRITDSTDNCRKLSKTSRKLLDIWSHWCQLLPCQRWASNVWFGSQKPLPVDVSCWTLRAFPNVVADALPRWSRKLSQAASLTLIHPKSLLAARTLLDGSSLHCELATSHKKPELPECTREESHAAMQAGASLALP